MTGPIPIIADVPTSEPRLGFADYAKALADAIRGGDPPQFTIGIYGVWGSGKSSLLNAVARNLDQSGTSTITVQFDAWRYEQSGQIVVPLLHTIFLATQKLADKRIMGYVRDALISIVYSLNFKLSMVGVEFSPKEMVKAPRGTDALSPLDQAFAKPFDEIRKIPSVLGGRRIVVLIDDLDRCSAENVLAVLESINLIMDIPGFIFVLALDHDVLVKAVETRYPHVGPGHLFIEKMVQVPFRVPRLDPQRIGFLEELIPEWKTCVDYLPPNFIEYADAIAVMGLDANPRQIKRFVNSVMVLRRIIEERGVELDYKLLAAVIGLQLRWPQHYRDLSDALYLQQQDPMAGLREATDEPGLQRYCGMFFTPTPPPEALLLLQQFSESVAPQAAVSEMVGMPATQLREVNRKALIDRLTELGFLRSDRSERLFYHPARTDTRAVIGKTVVRYERRAKGGDWDLAQSFLLTQELDQALRKFDELVSPPQTQRSSAARAPAPPPPPRRPGS